MKVHFNKSNFVDALLLGLVAYLSARLALLFLIQPYGMAPFWFANGIVLAVLLRRPIGDWPVLLVAVFTGHFTNQNLAGFPLYPDTVYGLVNVGEPLIAALFVRKISPVFRIESLRSIGILLMCTFFACLIGATVARLAGPIDFALWWIDDWLGAILVTPSILIFWAPNKRFPQIPQPSMRQTFEMMTLGLGMWLLTSTLFHRFEETSPLFYSYAVLPFLLAATLRFKTKGATIASLLLAIFTIGFTVSGYGPFAKTTQLLVDQSLSVQLFLAIVLLSHISLGAALEEREYITGIQRQQIQILEKIGRGESLALILNQIIRFVERLEDDLICSILLLDKDSKTIRHGAAPHLPVQFSQHIEGSRIGPHEGSCGAAAYSGEPVYAADVNTHPNWVKYKDIALKNHLRACWSTPIFSQQKEVLGTFAMYYRNERLPTEREIYWVNVATYLASVAITKEKNEKSIEHNASEKKNLETQVASAQRLDGLAKLAGGVAHDFNNILTIIMGNTSLIRLSADANKLDSKLMSKVDTIESAAERAQSLVRQILKFSKPQVSGNTVINPSPIVEEVARLLGSTLPSTIELRTRICPEHVSINVDPSQFHQIVMNLGTNAAHAMADERGILEFCVDKFTAHQDLVFNTGKLRRGKYVRVRVADNGHGIEKEIREKLFEPFFTTRSELGGTGLGLSVASLIAKNHGGILRFASHIGKGTIFTVYLPEVSKREVLMPAKDIVDAGANNLHIPL